MLFFRNGQPNLPPLPPKPEAEPSPGECKLTIAYKSGHAQEFHITQAPNELPFLDALAAALKAKRSYVFWGNAFFRLSEIIWVAVQKNDPKQAS